MGTVTADTALTAKGWRDNVAVSLGLDGRIEAIGDAGGERGDLHVDILLPAPANLHSHAFQRAMAGLSEQRSAAATDTFWTWRDLMFRFLDHLTPDDVAAIAALVQMEMLEAGYGAVGEFHYLHHQPGGAPYDDRAEMAARIAAAAAETGIGFTLLPVLYMQGGCDGRGLACGQVRFGNDLDEFTALLSGCETILASLPHDARLGVAPHSLRAVSATGLSTVASLRPDDPIHMHVAEQVAEVDEVVAAHGARPVQWLLDNHDVDDRWCLIHATQMEPAETKALARSGAVTGLCPITESSLGDGVFDGVRYLEAGGAFGVGSDSNIRISLSEELRTLEYSQRLRDKARARFARPETSVGRTLHDGACVGGARALGRNAGVIAPGKLADLVALDGSALSLLGKTGDTILDGHVFAGDDSAVTHVWSAGRHVVRKGRHIRRNAIVARYAATLTSLMARL
ncbi:MAG: formimidoylglutamate deiminase [Pseudomonadota bacterium]